MAMVAAMLAAFDALLAQPLLLLIVLAVGAGIGIGVEKLFAGIERDRRRASWDGRKANPKKATWRKDFQAAPLKGTPVRGGLDAADQLRVVENAQFTAQRLLNKSEAKLFAALDKAVVTRNPGWQVMAQVSLGEFLKSENPEAHSCINSKRVDFALMDPDCQVRHALEYQGTGHHLPGGAAAARDAVKTEALRKAGIGWHEAVAGHTTAGELRALVEKLVPAPKPEPKPPESQEPPGKPQPTT